ncbi:hypothetical protein [Embleya sp. NPDC059237]|uniref:hypothetical protein n=1 Tax=Embleya sp. NPDC059237 TaxID=3346784 RepID=UPI0036C9DCE8
MASSDFNWMAQRMLIRHMAPIALIMANAGMCVSFLLTVGQYYLGGALLSVCVGATPLVVHHFKATVRFDMGLIFVGRPHRRASVFRRIHRAEYSMRATRIAAWIAGKARPHLAAEWRDHLTVDPDAHSLGQRVRMVTALGFVVAALRMRVADCVDSAWRPVDWLLRTEARTNTLVAGAVGSLVIHLVRTDGLHDMITQNWQAPTALGAGLMVLARWLRRIRNIDVETSARAGRRAK